MVIASQLRAGMILRIEGDIYKVLEVEARAGAAKMGGVVKTKLSNVKSGRLWEPHFRPQERLEDLELERHMMEFLFAEGENCTFMNPQTFEQIEIAGRVLGLGAKFLGSGMEVPVEFFNGEPISVVLPDIMDARVMITAAPFHSQQDSACKEAVLENGVSIRVPPFIAAGELVRVEVRTGRYIERARAEHKRPA